MADTLVFHLNGRRIERSGVRPRNTLLRLLREEEGLTGAKYGCGEGECGACTVLVNGRATRSCVTPLDAVAGKRVTTIEGLAKGSALHPVQQAFLDADALQCGYCTPGMVLAAVALLDTQPNPDEASIRRQMNGNVCRCGTYPRIVEAVRIAARGRRA